MCEAVRAVNRTIKHLAVFVAIVVFGGSALAATLAFAVPATRALTFGTTSNGAITPVLQALEQRSVILDRNGNDDGDPLRHRRPSAGHPQRRLARA